MRKIKQLCKIHEGKLVSMLWNVKSLLVPSAPIKPPTQKFVTGSGLLHHKSYILSFTELNTLCFVII